MKINRIFCIEFPLIVLVGIFSLLYPKDTEAGSLCVGFINCCYYETICCDPVFQNLYPNCGPEGICVDADPAACQGCSDTSPCDDSVPEGVCSDWNGYRCRGSAYDEPGPGPGCSLGAQCGGGGPTPTGGGPPPPPPPTPPPPPNPSFEIAGRIWYDNNHNDLIDGEPTDQIVQNTSHHESCGTYYNITGDENLRFHFIGSYGLYDIDYHTGCNPQPMYYKYQEYAGTYTVDINLPAAYSIQALSHDVPGGCMVTGRETFQCTFVHGEPVYNVHILIDDLLPPAPVPNCRNLTGPGTIGLGTTGTFTATYVNGTGPVTARGLGIFNAGQCEPNPIVFWQNFAGGPGNQSFNWYPTAAGNYDVDCRAWNDGISECRGRCFEMPPWFAYQCAGSGLGVGTSMRVIVVPAPPQCTVTLLPNGTPYQMQYGSNTTFNAFPVATYGPVDNVTFESSNLPVLDPDTITDSSSPYQGNFTATGIVGTTTTLTARVYMGGVQRCSASTPIIITNPSAWWQVVDADVFSQGTITSFLPSGYFDVYGPGDFPGVPVYDGDYDFGSGEISTENWIADADYSGVRYDYNYFYDKIPADAVVTSIDSASISGNTLETIGTPDSKGYVWAKREGDLVIQTSNVDFVTRKLILFVNGQVTIQGIDVNLTQGTSLLMIIAKGNIILTSPDQADNIDGMFVTDEGFFTAPVPTQTNQLNFRGSIVTWNQNIDLNRTLSNNIFPAEVFTFAPDLLFLLPSEFGKRNIIWKEVVP